MEDYQLKMDIGEIDHGFEGQDETPLERQSTFRLLQGKYKLSCYCLKNK